jgi:HEAT repeat protein
MKSLAALLFLFFFNSHAFAEIKGKSHVLYLMQIGETEKSIDKYISYCSEENMADLETLQKMCQILMKKGVETKDPQTQLLAIFGAGIAQSSASFEVIENGLKSDDPQTQLVALHFISQYPEDRVDNLLINAMSSEHLQIRIEAAHILARRKHPSAVGQIESLMQKLPFFFKPYFPQLFAISGTAEAIASLKRLISDPYPITRVQAIMSVAMTQRDDLVDLIRKAASHTNHAEQEISAYTLGILKDSSSHKLLTRLSKSKDQNVCLAAYRSLYLLGDATYKNQIIQMAERQNLFAINALAEIEGSENTLFKLCSSKNLAVRINAMLSLLRRKDLRCVSFLKEFFISDTKDIAYQISHSIGFAHSAIKTISSASQKLKSQTVDLSLSLNLKQAYLREVLELDEKALIEVAKTIFDNNQNNLVPLLVSLLENKQTILTKALLKKYAKKAGAPFIRDYCNLALFRINEDKECESYIKKWLLRQNHNEIIQLQPYLSFNVRPENTKYDLDTTETSRLLIDIYLALASKQDEMSIYAVLDAMKKGNPKNRFVLAGLLILACSN